MAGNKAYRYPPTQHSDSIRVIKFWSGPKTGTIIFCNLINYRLCENPSFEALSYTWGDPILSRRIYTAKGFLKITENLAAALTVLRLEYKPRFLWADASDSPALSRSAILSPE